MSDDMRKSLFVGNLPEETVAALKDARMPTDAMSNDIVKRLRDDTRSAAHCALSEEAAAEIERLREENRKLRYEVNRSSYHMD